MFIFVSESMSTEEEILLIDQLMAETSLTSSIATFNNLTSYQVGSIGPSANFQGSYSFATSQGIIFDTTSGQIVSKQPNEWNGWHKQSNLPFNDLTDIGNGIKKKEPYNFMKSLKLTK